MNHKIQSRSIFIWLCLAVAPAALAKPRANAAARKAAASAPNGQSRLTEIKKAYRLGRLTKAATWEQLSSLAENPKISASERSASLEAQSLLLLDGGYPILAAIYSAQALRTAPSPFSTDLTSSWQTLRRVSEIRPILNILEITGEQVGASAGSVPIFANDWNYYAANAAARHGETAKALKLFTEVRPTDRHFLAAKYQQAMLLIEAEKLDEAESALVSVISAKDEKVAGMDHSQRTALMDYARLALGRIYYERQKFPAAITMYRAVNRSGRVFYDALFEQSWALFMAGYPAHALGSLHGVESPFFKDVFNPEAPLLRAMINYWLCRYEVSRNALADFMETYQPKVERLGEFLGRKRLDAETAYNLFENLVAGVSEESLGLPRSVLNTAAEQDSMLLIRDQYAAVVEEKQRLEAQGIFGGKNRLDRPMDYLQRWSNGLRHDIGRQFLAELQEMKKDFDRLKSQAEFLYVELLMSEKDQLLGKELHASTKITRVSKKTEIKGWGLKTQSWGDDRSGEYWWDEVGYYIQPVTSMCGISSKSE